MVANRGEIAIRIYRAATELGIRTIGVYSSEDCASPHRFRADEAYRIGDGRSAVGAYLSIDEMLRVAQAEDVDAIHPGYGFLSENPEFADACEAAGIIFIGPSASTLRRLGDKVSARDLAEGVGAPVLRASDELPHDPTDICEIGQQMGLPVIVKASWGGGGRGMRIARTLAELPSAVESARRESLSAFGRDEVYLERFIERARHIEVQVLGDRHGKVVHLYERDCSVQRRNQKIVECAPAHGLADDVRNGMHSAALALARSTNYVGAGTVEFLVDADTQQFFFIEVNPRIQVEHTVTEEVTGLDIVKAQIKIAEGWAIGEPETGIPHQDGISVRGDAIQCRITSEDPENNFAPDQGTVTAYRPSTGAGVRIDGCLLFDGAKILPHYDSLLEKVTCWGPDFEAATQRMSRALREYRIRGLATNLPFLISVIDHPVFRTGLSTTRMVDEAREKFRLPERRDRASKLLAYLADVTVNGHPDVDGRVRPNTLFAPKPLTHEPTSSGTRQRLQELGPSEFARWVREQDRLLITDTTMRDAHQSLLATRVRTKDILPAAQATASLLPELFSLECWGGATFDVAMRFLLEDPWERLGAIRERAPNILLQMLLRGANAVGYTNYPDNVIRRFVKEAAAAGIDVFRVFDCFNAVDNMRVAIDAVLESGAVCEGVVCYTGDLHDESRSKYNLDYYLRSADALVDAGCHILCIKDMAGLLKPRAARTLVQALRARFELPVHLHTHDTSGFAAATLIAATEAGVDIVDVAVDAMSGLTSQACMGSLVEALRGSDRDPQLSADAMRLLSDYWADVREQYVAFESGLKSGTAEVYLHEMPGGQFTNLKEQARAAGLGGNWPAVAQAYREANDALGDIIKVTPSSKVVGDLALVMAAQGISRVQLEAPDTKVDVPSSVLEMLRGDLGVIPGGWPAQILTKFLADEVPLSTRPGENLAPFDFAELEQRLEMKLNRTPRSHELVTAALYPKVFSDYLAARGKFGPVDKLPTIPFFYGLKPGEAISVEIERGKELLIRLVTLTHGADGTTALIFELNGQLRVITCRDKSLASTGNAFREAEADNPLHVAAPIAGMVTAVLAEPGKAVRSGDGAFVVESMKMETRVCFQAAGTVRSVTVTAGSQVSPKQLLAELESL